MSQLRCLHPYPDVGAMQADVAQRIADMANQCIQEQGSFHIVLTGGNTPRAIYRELQLANTDWSAWHVYMGDERCLPEGDAERNDHMASETLLSHVLIPATQKHMIPAQLGAEEGAQRYREVISKYDSFDLVLLGFGEDGHVASLFPGHEHDEAALVVPVHDSPKPPPDRISLTAQVLSSGLHTWFLVAGEGKRDALTRWLADDDIPANRIRPDNGVDIFTDLEVGSD